MRGSQRKRTVQPVYQPSATMLRDLLASIVSGDVSTADSAFTTSLEEKRPKKQSRRRRCSTCGLLYPQEELQVDFDEEGRRVGWICDGC